MKRLFLLIKTDVLVKIINNFATFKKNIRNPVYFIKKKTTISFLSILLRTLQPCRII
jgi:hypothetical protein